MLLVFTLPLLFLALMAGIGVCLWLYTVLGDREWSHRKLLGRAVAGAIACMAMLGLYALSQ